MNVIRPPSLALLLVAKTYRANNKVWLGHRANRLSGPTHHLALSSPAGGRLAATRARLYICYKGGFRTRELGFGAHRSLRVFSASPSVPRPDYANCNRQTSQPNAAAYYHQTTHKPDTSGSSTALHEPS